MIVTTVTYCEHGIPVRVSDVDSCDLKWMDHRVRGYLDMVSEMIIDVEFGDSFRVYGYYDKCVSFY